MSNLRPRSAFFGIGIPAKHCLVLVILSLGICWNPAAATAQSTDNSVQDLLSTVQKAAPSAAPAPTPSATPEQPIPFLHQVLYAHFPVALLCLTTIAVLVITLGYLKDSRKCFAHDMLHATNLIYLIFAMLFVLAVSEDDKQITYAVGLLGAIAGYLFGTSTAARGKQILPAEQQE